MRQIARKLLRFLTIFCALALALAPGARAEGDEVDLLAVDHRLYELGYRDGACSGVLDDVMVNALRNFQQANGLGVTGQPDAGTVLVLLSSSATSQADYLARIAQESSAMPPLSVGAYGPEVRRLQDALLELGYLDVSGDGNFGDDTMEAVCRFQLACGLDVTGIADAAVFARLYGERPIEWATFLDSCVSSVGDSGEGVRLLQRWLAREGYYEGAYTARFGDETQRAVRRFQRENELEASGNVDIETVRALFTNVRALRSEAATLRRGKPGARALCDGLTALGYPAHESFDMQTELALMQFQFANGMEVTGEAGDSELVQLSAPDAVGRAGYVASGAEAALDEGFPEKLASRAEQLLGEVSGFDEEFGLVQYVYLRCGVAVLALNQFNEAEGGLNDAQPGDVMALEVDGSDHCGIVASDGGLVYRDASSRIVMIYPRLVGAINIRLYRLAVQ